MSLVSLEKFLYSAEADNKNQHKDDPKGQPPAPPVNDYLSFSVRLIETVRASLKGQAVADLAGKFEALTGRLEPSAEASALDAVAADFGQLLTEFHNRLKQADTERAEDFRKVLTTLKETFTQLSIGGQGADLRFQKLDDSLSVASQMDDMKALRTHLSHTLQFVRQEGQRDKRHAKVMLDSLGGQIRSSQETINRFGSSMASRDAAISNIELALKEKGEFEVMIFAADILKRLSALHGPALADSLLDELTRRNLQRLAPDGKIFRWSNTAVAVLCKAGRKDAAPSGTSDGLFEYQAFVGDRVTNFRVALRSLTIPLRGSSADIAGALDIFAAS